MINQAREIKEIIINNFQSHSCTKIKPARNGQLTVITGQSRNGKTAIFRALRWFYYNQPDGTDYLQWGKTSASVAVEFTDGMIVERFRSASKNLYRIVAADPLTPIQVFEGFGRGVPLEVQQAIGVCPIEFGEGMSLNLNMAEQLDGPFLGNKSVSGLQRAKVLGKLAGTEEVDMAGKTLATDLSRWRRERDDAKEQIVELEEKLKQYDWLPQFRLDLERLKTLHGFLARDSEILGRAEKMFAEYEGMLVDLEDLAGRRDRLDRMVEKAIPLVERAAAEASQVAILKKIHGEISAVEYDIFQLIKIIDNTEFSSSCYAMTQCLEMNLARVRKLQDLVGQSMVIGYAESKAAETMEETSRIAEAEQAAQRASQEDELLRKLTRWIYLNSENDTLLAVEKRRLLQSEHLEESIVLQKHIDALLRRKDALSEVAKGLAETYMELRGTELVFMDASVNADRQEKKYADKLAALGICPLCGNDLHPEKCENEKEAI